MKCEEGDFPGILGRYKVSNLYSSLSSPTNPPVHPSNGYPRCVPTMNFHHLHFYDAIHRRFPRSTGTRLREFPSVTDPIGSFPSIRSLPPYPPFIPGPDCTFQPANLGLPRGRIDLELANAARMKGTDDAAGKASNRERAFSGNTENQTPLKRVKFPRYLEMGPNITDWNCLFEQGMFKSNAWISWIFFRFGHEGMTRERKEISSLKIIEGNRNLDRRGWASRSKKYDLATRKWFQGTSEKESLPWIRKVERGAAKCLSNPIFFRLVRYPFTRVRSRWKLQGFVLGLARRSNDNEPRSFFPYVIARPMTFSLRKWLQRSLRYETIRLRQLFQQRYVAVLRPSRENGFESAKFIGEGIRRNALCFA